MSTVDVGMQFDSIVDRPRIRKTRNFMDEIKSTCAEVSVKCNVSTQASRIAVQTVCSGLYDHDYYLTKEEAIENDPSLEEYKSVTPKPPKRSKSAEKSEAPRSSSDYKVYENVLPSAKTINI